MSEYKEKRNETSSEDSLINDVTNTENRNNVQPITTAADDFNYFLGEDKCFDISSFEEDGSDEPVFKAADRGKKNKIAQKRAVKIKTIIWMLVIIAVSVVLAFAILLFASEYLGIGFGRSGQCTVEIEKGMGTAQIASELKEAGAINSSFMFRLYSKISGNDGTYQYGVYTFSNELGYGDIADMLQNEGASAETVEVTIPEMARVDQIMEILEEKGVCTKSDFRNAVLNGNYQFDFVEDIPEEEVYYKFEGYLFPDTYQFYCYDSAECAELAIYKMLENTDKKLTKEVRAKINDSGYTIHEVLTMASIVELEASSSVDEMPNVAAVFYNRLNWDEPKLLGSSPTAEYPFGNGRYDTNKNEGLPPGPLCAPSENAILAAVNPTENFTATYFVTDDEMKFYYNNSLAAHNQTIANLKQQGKWLG